MTTVPKEKLTIQMLRRWPLGRRSLPLTPTSRRSSVCTWSVLPDVRQRKQPGIPFDGDEHHCEADKPNLTTGLLRGKLVPRGSEFWRCSCAPGGSVAAVGVLIDAQWGFLSLRRCYSRSSVKTLRNYDSDLAVSSRIVSGCAVSASRKNPKQRIEVVVGDF